LFYSDTQYISFGLFQTSVVREQILNRLSSERHCWDSSKMPCPHLCVQC